MFAFCKNTFLLFCRCLVLALLCFVHAAESFEGGEPALQWHSVVGSCPYSYSSSGPALACACADYKQAGYVSCSPSGRTMRGANVIYACVTLTLVTGYVHDGACPAMASIQPIVEPPTEPESDPEPEPEVTPEPEPGTDPEPQTGPRPKPCPKDVAPRPVKIARGEKYYHFTDINVSGSFPLQFGRTYRSEVIGKISGSEIKPEGAWYWSQLSKRLYSTSTTVYIVRGNQRGGLHFTASGSNWIQADAGVGIAKSTLTGNSTAGWILTLPDGRVEQYNASGYITLESTAQGLSHSISYTGASSPGLTQTMTIHDNRTGDDLVIMLDASGNPLSASKDGVTVQYLWDANGRLQAVVYPDDDIDATNNPVQVFEYNAAADASAMQTWDALTQTNKLMTWKVTGIFEVSRAEFDASVAATPTALPESKRYSKVTYDALGRVNTSALWNGMVPTEELTFAYNWDWSSSTTAPTTTVTNTNGLATVYSYQTSTALNSTNSPTRWKLISVAGNALTACRSTSANTTYSLSTDPEGAGFVKTTSDKTGAVFTKRTRDTNGRITVLETALNGSQNPTLDSQKIVTGYWYDTTLPATKTYYGHKTNAWVAYRSEVLAYDSNNRMTSRTVTDELNSVSRVWTYVNTYHSAPNDKTPSSIVINGPLSGSGDSSTYTYNALGQLQGVENALGHEITYADYSAFGLPETITDANGVDTEIIYDARGRVDTITRDPGLLGISAETDFDYYPNNLLKKTTQADGSYLEYFYNSAHQLIGVENNHGDYIKYTPSLLDGNWTVQEVCTAGDSSSGCTGATIAKFERVFDALGRLSKIKDASGVEKQLLGYDSNNNVATRLLQGNTTNTPTHDNNDLVMVNEYDALHRLMTSVGSFACAGNCTLDSYNNYSGTVPSTPETSYAYNGQGLVSSVTDAEGQETTFGYNGFGELTQEVSHDRGTTTYAYDGAGNLDTKTDARGKVTKYQYDNVNRLTGIDYGFSDSFSADISYTYDQNDSAHGKGRGRLTHVVDGSGTTDYKYNALGRVTEKQFDPAGSVTALVTAYDYNDNGALIQITYPGGRVVDYARANGRLSDMTLHYAASSLAINGINYQSFGGINQYTRAFENADTLGTVRGVDNNGLLETLNTSFSTGGTIDFAYGYDAFNNIAQINDALNPGINQSFSYDALQRLKTATGVYGRYTYGYDAVGNRQSMLLERSTPTAPTTFNEVFTETYGYETGTHRLNSILRHDSGDVLIRSRTLGQDDAGNTTSDSRTQGGSTTTRTLIYGDDNRLHNVTVP